MAARGLGSQAIARGKLLCVTFEPSRVRRRIFAAGVAASLALVGAACRLRSDSRQPEQAAPSFALVDQDGKAVTLDGLRAQGHAVLVFYRGHW